MWMAIAITLARESSLPMAVFLIETALSYLDVVVTVFLLSCSVLIAGKIHPFLLSGHFSSFSITRYSNKCAVMQETYIREQPLCCHHAGC